MSVCKSTWFFLGFLVLKFIETNPLPVNPCNEFQLENKIERIIEKVVAFFQDINKFFHENSICISEEMAEKLIELIKDSIECESQNEKEYLKGNKTIEDYNSEECFRKSNKEIKRIALERLANHCPEKIPNKDYLINVTAMCTKTYRVIMNNGLQITRQEIEYTNETEQETHEKTQDRVLEVSMEKPSKSEENMSKYSKVSEESTSTLIQEFHQNGTLYFSQSEQPSDVEKTNPQEITEKSTTWVNIYETT